MSQAHDVVVLVGSLRAESLNRRVALALAERAPASITLEIVGIGDLPFYNSDLETDAPPPAWTRFRERVARADALLFVTPEYNRSVPAALKNALDVGSRPYGKSVFGGKPGAVVSVSPGAIGGFGANHHLRQSLVFLDVPQAGLCQIVAFIAAIPAIVPPTFLSEPRHECHSLLIITLANREPLQMRVSCNS